MTDRLHGLHVVFDKDIREDDAQALIDAISMLKHVLAVRPMKTDAATWAAEERAKFELRGKILDILKRDI